jgi:hypothetical protein
VLWVIRGERKERERKKGTFLGTGHASPKSNEKWEPMEWKQDTQKGSDGKRTDQD